MSENTPIEIKTTVLLSPEQAWKIWTEAEHIVNWNFASPEWHCPNASNDLFPGGRFSWRMEAKDGSMGFDYSGTYDQVDKPNHIKLTLDDDRKVEIRFQAINNGTEITEIFEPDTQAPAELQRQGWQSILNNFKGYAESLAS